MHTFPLVARVSPRHAGRLWSRLAQTTRPSALAAICRKAMAADPASRYASDLASDVSRYLDAEPVSAYPEGIFGKSGRFISRHRIAFLLVLTFAAVRLFLFLLFRR